MKTTQRARDTKPCYGVNTYAALLRGVNVGGKNPLPMKDLAELFAKQKCFDVRTYIQSGNVIFSAQEQVARGLAAAVAKKITGRYGFRTPVILRTRQEIEQATQKNPFLLENAPQEQLHVYFLSDLPAPDTVQALDPDRSPPDSFRVLGREIFVQLPNGMARTKLTNDYFDKKLGVVSTARNWRTVLKLQELMSA